MNNKIYALIVGGVALFTVSCVTPAASAGASAPAAAAPVQSAVDMSPYTFNNSGETFTLQPTGAYQGVAISESGQRGTYQWKVSPKANPAEAQLVTAFGTEVCVDVIKFTNAACTQGSAYGEVYQMVGGQLEFEHAGDMPYPVIFSATPH